MHHHVHGCNEACLPADVRTLLGDRNSFQPVGSSCRRERGKNVVGIGSRNSNLKQKTVFGALVLEQYFFPLFIYQIFSRQSLQSISAVLEGTRRNISAVRGIWYSSNWTCTLRYNDKFFGINWIQKSLGNPREQKNNWSVAFSGNRKHPD